MEKASTKNDLFRCFCFFQDVSSLVPQEKESEDQQKDQLFEDLSSHNLTPAKITTNLPKMDQDSKENESSEAKPLTISAIKLFSGDILYTPQKTNMESEHHQFEKEKHLPSLHFWVSMLKFQGRIPYTKNFMGFFYVESTRHLLERSEAEMSANLDSLQKEHLFPLGFFRGKNTNAVVGGLFWG